MQLERPLTMREFQRMFHYIYGGVNEQYRDADIILCLMKEVGTIMELARKDRRDDFKVQLPRVFSWSCALATRLGIDLQTALWNKYPGVCPYCLREKDCICGTEHPFMPNKGEILRRLRREHKDREPTILSGHQAMRKKLYAWQNERIMLIQIAAHLAEEAAEVSHDFRHKYLDGVAEELADVFSWIFGLATRLGLDVSDIVWERYPFECEKCHHVQCQCEQPV